MDSGKLEYNDKKTYIKFSKPQYLIHRGKRLKPKTAKTHLFYNKNDEREETANTNSYARS